MKKSILFFASFMMIGAAVQAAPGVDLDYMTAVKSGGNASVFFKGESIQAFSQPAANMNEDEIRRHVEGDALFERNFTDEQGRFNYGMGPVFNNTSCGACHAKDGRGALPVLPFNQEWVQLRQNESIFLRISIENGSKVPKTKDHNWGAPQAVPGFSTQLFHLGSLGVREDLPGAGQAQVWMKFEQSAFTYPDGRVVALRKPVFKVTEPYDQYFDSVTGEIKSRLFEKDVHMGPRMGPPMIGLGLLEAIQQSDILSLAARDLSSEGVHGTPNWVYDIQKDLAGNPFPVSLGRFGLKANTPSVFHQSLGALNGDIGVTNYAFPTESIFGTKLFEAFRPRLGELKVEAPREYADGIVFYSQTLAVPARRNVDDPEVMKGAVLFHEVNCTSCHQPSFVTGPHAVSALAYQKIYPYSDMLLHDMGEGLSDGRQDFDATGRQWKTRPLWGIGHTQTINPRAGYLHDGRARTLEEAILWHEGEAASSRDKFVNLSQASRDQLVRFIRSL